MKKLVALFLTAQLFGCTQEESNHPVFKYYPPNDVFEEGFVNKYYRHNYPKNQDARAATEVTYSSLRKEGNKIFIEKFNAGFELAAVTELRVSDNGDVFTEKLTDIVRMDTIPIEILSPVSSRWINNQDEPYKIRYSFSDKYYQFTERQLKVYDTLIDGKAAKVFIKSGEYLNEETGEVTNRFMDTTTYLTDIGFFESRGGNENYRFETEMVEQMPLDEFKKRANHGEHRVAYIDPSNTLENGEQFKICGQEKSIADYYNSTPDGRYFHGKRAMMDTIFDNLDRAKLFDQNGSLVFRFVVNCEGKAGRFIGEGYDPNYHPMEFNPETIDHLFSILRKLKEWRAVVIREEARDAYFYINFKIENGEIIDILP
ncbi:hypothetical protein [Ekhidna sp.]